MTKSCCDVQGHTCNQGRDCPVALARRCAVLGMCQGKSCADCEAFECEVACSPEPARPTYPFAPGVIQKAPHGRYIDKDGEWFPLSLADTAKLLCLLAMLSCLAGYLVEKFA